jgi:hypothetical protein
MRGRCEERSTRRGVRSRYGTCARHNGGVSRPVRHHQVAQALLRRFTRHDLLVMRPRVGPDVQLSPTNAAVERHFYSYVDPTGAYNTELEEYLGREVEGPAAGQLERLLVEAPENVDMVPVVRFVAWQLMRSPLVRHLLAEFGREIGPLLAGFDAVSAWRRGNASAPWDADPAKRVFDAARSEPPPAYRQVPDRNVDIRTIVRYADQFTETLSELRWVVAHADRDVFVIGDSPAVVFRPTLPSGGFGGLAVTSEAELRLPLGPRHVLLGAVHALGPERIAATAQLTRESNAAQARDCVRAIYFRPGTTGLTEIQPSKTPPGLPTPTITVEPSESPASEADLPQLTDDRLAALIDRTYARDQDDHT